MPQRKALAMIEYTSIAQGIIALDIITKTAEVDILSARPICPGKYMILFCGDLAAVNASLEAARQIQSKIDDFILGRPHPSIFAALNQQVKLQKNTALGLIETYSGAAAIKAADTSAKTAYVNLAQIRIAEGMCGKSTVMLTGDIAAVAAALDAAKADANDANKADITKPKVTTNNEPETKNEAEIKEATKKWQPLNTALIPNPDEKMLAAINASAQSLYH